MNARALRSAVALMLFCGVNPGYGQSPPPFQGFPDSREAPTRDWKGNTFRLSQRYPTAVPPIEDYPWKQIDPRTQSEDYLRAVLRYAFEGNEDSDWDGASNKVRNWYNAPWLHWGRNGREFIHVRWAGLSAQRYGADKWNPASCFPWIAVVGHRVERAVARTMRCPTTAAKFMPLPPAAPG